MKPEGKETVPNVGGKFERLMRAAQAPLPFSRRQAFSVIGGLLALAGAGAVSWNYRRELRDTVAMQVWLPTAFDGEVDVRACRHAADAIRHVFARKHSARFGEWLYVYEEPGQTFNAYLRQYSPATRPANNIIQVLPWGEYDERRIALVRDVVELASLFYGSAVQMLPVESLPPDAPEYGPSGQGTRQLLTQPLLDALKSRVPAPAAALLAMTPRDLTPGHGWNYVFGMASLVDRVGVWSLARLADARTPRAVVLRRAASVALHEIGHMLGIWHCTTYECCMNGANSLRESDAVPLAFCPECDAKVWWRLRMDPRKRYSQLANYAERQGWESDEMIWRQCGQALGHA
jgi:archaemetzincin